MAAVYKHEIKTYFTNVYGYVFSAFLLVFAGIYTMAYNLKGLYTNFEYVPASMSFVFLIIVPILTMRVLAEERKQKTDQLLYALPLGMTRVILGKFAAMLTVFLVPTLIMCVYPVILSTFGNVYFPAAYGALLAFFLLGAALISIGMFISSITESQAVAAGVCFGVMLLNYFLASLASYVSTEASASLAALTIIVILIAVVVRIVTKSTFLAVLVGAVFEAALIIFYVVNTSAFSGLFADIMEKLSLFERFNVFIDGVFDITGIVYFLSVIGIFLFLSVQSMEKRRWN